MKNLITILLLFVSINAQDVLNTLSGKKYKGKLIEQQPRHVLFQPDGSPNAQSIPITSINNIQLGNGKIIEFGKDILTTKSGDTYKGYYLVTAATIVEFFIKKDMQKQSFDKKEVDNIKLSNGLNVDLELITKNMSEEDRNKYNEALNNRRLQQLCEEKKGVKVLVMPIKDDLYGLTEMIEENHDSLCYNMIENELGLKYLHDENITSDYINDFHLLEAGNFVGANIVIYGYAYTFDVPYKYSPTTSDVLAVGELWQNEYNDAWTDLFNALGKSLVVGGQLSDRSKAITEAGSYVKLTYFSLNIDTGRKIFIAKNLTVLKIG